MPPSLILEVLRITEAEMDLRDLTRETEQARLGMKRVDYEDFADTLVGEQIDLTERTEQVVWHWETKPYSVQSLNEDYVHSSLCPT